MKTSQKTNANENRGSILWLTLLASFALTGCATTTVNPIQTAIMDKDPEKAEKLVKKGLDLNETDEYGNTVLHYAAGHNYSKLVKAILDTGFEVDVTNSYEMTPLFNAARGSFPESAEILINAGADINARDQAGESALYAATADYLSTQFFDEQFKTVSLLLEKNSTIYDIEVKEIGDNEKIAKLYRWIGEYCEYKKRTSHALNCYKKSIRFYKEAESEYRDNSKLLNRLARKTESQGADGTEDKAAKLRTESAGYLERATVIQNVMSYIEKKMEKLGGAGS